MYGAPPQRRLPPAPSWLAPRPVQPSSAHATRGAFATKHLWVTPYHPSEMNPAGDYPLHPNPEENPGIADWTRADRWAQELGRVARLSRLACAL